MAMPAPKKSVPSESPAGPRRARGAMQTRQMQGEVPELERASQMSTRQSVRSPRKNSRIRGGNLAVAKRREDPALNAIMNTSRITLDPGPSYRMNLGVVGALTGQVLEDQGLLYVDPTEGAARAGCALERQQVVLRRYEDASERLGEAIKEVFSKSRNARIADIPAFMRHIAGLQSVIGKAGCSTLGGSIFECGVMGHGLKIGREFSEVPTREQALKARMFAVQHDGVRIVGLAEEGGMKDSAVFGFVWTDGDGEKHVAGLRLPDATDAASPEPEVVLGAALSRNQDGTFERIVAESQSLPLSEFLAQQGIEIDPFAGALTAQDLQVMKGRGLTPITAPVHTGDFLPDISNDRPIRERLIPGRLIFEGTEGMISDLDLLMEVADDLRSSLEIAIQKWADEPNNAKQVEAAAKNNNRSPQSILTGEVDRQMIEAEMTLGLSHAKMLNALKDYIQEREKYPKTVRPDPFQVDVGREVTTLLSNLGYDPVRDRSFYVSLDRILDKAHEKFGSDPDIVIVRDPIQRHILVMRKAMEEIKNQIIAKKRLRPEVEADKANLDLLEDALGSTAQDRVNGDFLRGCRGVMEKGMAMRRAIGQALADAVLDVALAERVIPESDASIVRSRLAVRFKAKDDPYERSPLTISRGKVTEWREPQPKPPAMVAVDAKLDAFLALDENGEWTNPGMRAATYAPDVIFSLPDHVDGLPNRAKMRLQRAREGFKMVDSIMGAMEDHRNLPEYALRLTKALGAVTRDGHDDALKSTNPFDAISPVVEEGRVYIAPVTNRDKGAGWLMLRLEPVVEGGYRVLDRIELSDARLAEELDRRSMMDHHVSILRHAIDRSMGNTEILQRFGCYDLGGRFLLSVKTDWNGPVLDGLGIEMRGGYWPDASYDAHKTCLLTRVPAKDSQGAARLDANGIEVPVVAGQELGGPHTYVVVRERGTRQRRNVFIPMPDATAEVQNSVKAFGIWLDQRAAKGGLGQGAANLYPFFRTVALDCYQTLATQNLDPDYAGFACLRPRQQGIFDPDLFSQTLLPVQERSLKRQDRVKAGSAAIAGLNRLTEQRCRLGAGAELQTVSV